MSDLSTSDPKSAQPVAVLCGSVTRAVAALDAAEAHYRSLGYVVHKPVADDSLTPQEHAERWYALIDACRETDVVVMCRSQGDRFGEQTMREWNRAVWGLKTIHHFGHVEERAS